MGIRDFNNILKTRRVERGLTQTALAEKAGLRPSAISHFEKGFRMPSSKNIKKLANALGVTTDYLLGRSFLHEDDFGVAFRHSENVSPNDRDFVEKMKKQLVAQQQTNQELPGRAEVDGFKIRNKAQEVLDDLSITELPIDPIEIAEHHQILVEAKQSEGVSGMLLKVGKKFAIGYSKHTNNEENQRFSVAHELGHYFLDGHIEVLLSNGGVHTSQMDMSEQNRYEKEANLFASELLMPRRLIKDDIKEELSWKLVGNIAEKCKTSLEAAARRVIYLSTQPCALIIQYDNDVQTPVRSPSWRGFIDKMPFPKDILDYEEGTLPKKMDECEFDDWTMDSIRDYQCFYSSVQHNVGKTERIMTLLSLEEKDEEYPE